MKSSEQFASSNFKIVKSIPKKLLMYVKGSRLKKSNSHADDEKIETRRHADSTYLVFGTFREDAVEPQENGVNISGCHACGCMREEMRGS